MADNASAFASFEQKWFDAHPEYAVASIFLAPEQRAPASAFGCLIHELDEALLPVSEPQVVTAKLGWWHGELAAAAAGRGSHPITRELFAHASSRQVPAGLWPALAEAALARLSQASAATQADLLARHAGFYQVVAEVDAALAPAPQQAAGSDATLWTISRLLRALSRLHPEAEPLPLPLDLLARHGLTRSGLAAAGKPRTALLRDHLAGLAAALESARPNRASRNLHQRVRTRLDAALIAAALAADDPLQHLRDRAQPGRWPSLWASWREARALASERAGADAGFT